ncbi:MAG: hypothetical protein HY739_12465 [Desulfobacterales bacterium]|nr:hypothetical protein [Desulfobacterales bacterium]
MEWEKPKSYYKEDTESKFIQRLFKELYLRGMLDIIRHGITNSGVKQVEGICSLSTKA